MFSIFSRGEAALRNRSGVDPSKDSDDIEGAFKKYWMYGEKEEGQYPTLPEANRHEQEDGSILAVAATGKQFIVVVTSAFDIAPNVPLDMADIIILMYVIKLQFNITLYFYRNFNSRFSTIVD